MLTKEKIKKTIDLMPDNVTIDELIETRNKNRHTNKRVANYLHTY